MSNLWNLRTFHISPDAYLVYIGKTRLPVQYMYGQLRKGGEQCNIWDKIIWYNIMQYFWNSPSPIFFVQFNGARPYVARQCPITSGYPVFVRNCHAKGIHIRWLTTEMLWRWPTSRKWKLCGVPLLVACLGNIWKQSVYAYIKLYYIPPEIYSWSDIIHLVSDT